MNLSLPITQGISSHIRPILEAVEHRSLQLERISESRGVIYHVAITVLKNITIPLGVLAISGMIVFMVTMSFTALKVTIVAAIIALGCFSLRILLQPYNSSELLVRSNWKSLQQALKEGDGKHIVKISKELALQKNTRPDAFKKCLNDYKFEQELAEVSSEAASDNNENLDRITKVLQRTLLIGNFLLAVVAMDARQYEEASRYATEALLHSPGLFPEGVAACLENLQQMTKRDKETALEWSNLRRGKGISVIEVKPENRLYMLDLLS